MKPERESYPGTTPVAAAMTQTASGETLHVERPHYTIGLTTDCNKRFRKQMEDAQVVIPDFLGLRGCFYLAVFDGHAGAQSSKACAAHLHHLVARNLAERTRPSVSEALALSFEQMDELLKEMSVQHSGTTAAVAVCGYARDGALVAFEPGLERHLWLANVGDARGVCGVQKADGPDWDAFRLTYDHKGSDEHERRRITNAGGIVLHNRVNGMLAVTRSLGDLFMKDYVVGAPYTTDTLLTPNHRALVVASDGLWDVCSDSEAVDLVRGALANGSSAQDCSAQLLEHAVQQLSADNLTIVVATFNHM